MCDWKAAVVKAHKFIKPLFERAEHSCTFAACVTEFVKAHEVFIATAVVFIGLAIVCAGLAALETLLGNAAAAMD